MEGKNSKEDNILKTDYKKNLSIAMLGHKRIPSREGGIEIVVEELATSVLTYLYLALLPLTRKWQ